MHDDDCSQIGAFLQGEKPAQPIDEGYLVSLQTDPAAGRDMTEEEIITGLAKLPELEYAKCRKDESKKLGINVGNLDRLVNAKRRDATAVPGIVFDEIEPWKEIVGGAALLNDLTATIRRFIICSPDVAQAAALWVVMTWLMDIVQTAPLALITAPEMRCGKSQLLTLIGNLSFRPLASSSISPAALFRVIQEYSPTLTLDEADATLNDNEELRGLINSGHQRANAYTIRCVGDDHTPTRFSTWGAKAIAGIGKPSPTLVDRSIILTLRRKLPHEEVARLRYAEPDLFSSLRSKLKRWTDDNREAVRLARPAIPPTLNDRAQDNWEPLLAIADTAGGIWPELARQTAQALSATDDTASTGAELLTDIQAVFDKLGDRISSAELISHLCQDDEAPWATWNRGKQMTPRQLAKRLKEYGIAPKNVRWGGSGSGVVKGFERAQFEDAWSRYISIPSAESATPLPIDKNAKNTNSYPVAAKNPVAATTPPNPLPDTHGQPVPKDLPGLQPNYDAVPDNREEESWGWAST